MAQSSSVIRGTGDRPHDQWRSIPLHAPSAIREIRALSRTPDRNIECLLPSPLRWDASSKPLPARRPGYATMMESREGPQTGNPGSARLTAGNCPALSSVDHCDKYFTLTIGRCATLQNAPPRTTHWPNTLRLSFIEAWFVLRALRDSHRPACRCPEIALISATIQISVALPNGVLTFPSQSSGVLSTSALNPRL
jgi:hypothetical protein